MASNPPLKRERNPRRQCVKHYTSTSTLMCSCVYVFLCNSSCLDLPVSSCRVPQEINVTTIRLYCSSCEGLIWDSRSYSVAGSPVSVVDFHGRKHEDGTHGCLQREGVGIHPSLEQPSLLLLKYLKWCPTQCSPCVILWMKDSWDDKIQSSLTWQPPSQEDTHVLRTHTRIKNQNTHEHSGYFKGKRIRHLWKNHWLRPESSVALPVLLQALFSAIFFMEPN